jgi:anti-sigma B factor antagonist
VLLSLESSTSGARAVLKVGGRLDLPSSSELRSALDLEIERGPSRLVVDLADVDFLDSTGLGVLVGAQRKASSRDVEMVLSSAQEIVERVLRVTNAVTILPLYPDTASALAQRE